MRLHPGTAAMKLCSALTLTLALLLATLPIAAAAEIAPRPNLLFIFLDDFGWRDAGFMGSDFYETPHLDALAAAGMVFTDAYSCAANCAPARACLLSGQYTPRHEIYNVGTGPRGKAAHRRLQHIPGTDTLRPDIVTWAACLHDAGYRTATMGKWHLSDDPLPYGFDLNIGGTHSGGPPQGYLPPHGKAPGLADVPEDEYLTDTLSHRAATFVRESTGHPWALYLTHFAVHTPLNPKPSLVAKYEAKTPGKLHNHVAMATMIQAVDDGVGEILCALEESGQRDNTVIVFFSDNGGYGPATDMDPLKGYKGTYYEGGIREPMFVVWPGVVEPGSRSSTPVIGVDLYPTFCEIAGATLPDQPLDGVSLVHLLSGDPAAADALAHRPLFWHFPAYLESYGGRTAGEQRDPLFRSRPCSVIRQGDWKLHEYFEDGGLELYDLRADIGETRNLVDEQPAKRDELHSQLKAWRRKLDAPVPTTLNPDFDAEAEAHAQATALSKR